MIENDKTAIIEVLNLYGFALDAKQWDLFDDALVRTARGWRIKRRVCRLMAWTGNPSVPEPNIGQAPDMKTHVLRLHCEEGKVGYFNALKAKQARL